MSNLATDRRSVIDDIKLRLAVPEVLDHLGWRISHNGKRADCGLCGGKEDVAVRQEVWNCHRCQVGGDIFTLIERAQDVDFRSALKCLASLARVELPARMTPDERRRLAKQEAQHKRIGRAAVRLDVLESELRWGYRDLIHRCQQKHDQVARRLAQLRDGEPEHRPGETEGCWAWMATLLLIARQAVAAYSLLSFGSALDRAVFTLRPEMRLPMIEQALVAGVVDDDGRRMEVME